MIVKYIISFIYTIKFNFPFLISISVYLIIMSIDVPIKTYIILAIPIRD